MMKISKKSKEGTCRKIASFSIIAMIFNVVIAGLFSIPTKITYAEPNEQMCEAAVDVVLIMDRSGSMYNSLSQAKDAANSFLGNLGNNDQSALVSYSDDASLDKGLSNDHIGGASSTEAYVNSLSSGGLTNIGDAIAEGTDELSSSGRQNAVKTMILLTDGRANRPSNVDPIQYAKDKAAEAASSGYIIFTIGLGSSINETTLQEIAYVTGGRYYNAPSASDLEGIYNSISTRVCEYGSISGCKYEDSDKDGDKNDFSEENTVSDWEIILGGDADFTQLTEDGCYSFTGLLPGTYTIREGGKIGVLNFEQTFPSSPDFYTINLSEGENVVNIDFGNYIPYCGNDFVDYGEICEIGDTMPCQSCDGYNGIKNCNQNCSGWGECITQEKCGDGIKNGNEECDGTDGTIDHYYCTNQCLLEYIPWCGDGEVNQQNEECDGDSPRECVTKDGYSGFQICDSCFWNACDTNEYCGDGTINGNEECDDGQNNGIYGYCNTDCTGQTLSVCGNGVLEEPDEQCDDGNTNDGDGCSSVCQIEIVYQCSDNIDNDGDGLIDADDPGCHTDGDSSNEDSYEPTDDDEYDSPISEGDIIINELMWMGSDGDTTDEWVELKNTTQSPIENLNGCKLYKKGGNEIADLSGLIIDADGYLVVSRKNQDDSKINITPDLVSSSVRLSNTELEITLYCGQTLIDAAGNGNVPLNGDNGDIKKSMSRKVDIGDGTLADSWCVAVTQGNWDIEAEELGTPGAENVCNFISGYKFNDLNGNGIWDEGEAGIRDWLINLYDNIDLINSIASIKTSADLLNLGYYEFTNLISGTYFVKELNQDGWSQTSPTDPSYYEVTISEENPISENNNFGNYKEKSSISGCKYSDNNNNGEINEEEEKLSGWKIQLIKCPYSPLEEGASEFLPKTRINTNTDLDQLTVGYCSVIETTVTGEDGCYSFTDLEAGDYGVSEETSENWTQTLPADDAFYYFNLTDGETKTDINFLNYYEQPEVYQCSDGNDNDGDGYIDYPNDPGCDSSEDDDENNCGDGTCDANFGETCSTCSQDCGSCGGGGGGGVITKPTIIITNESVKYLGNGEALVTWTTNIETTRQVAYGDDSISTLGDAPEYGYDFVSEESTDMTKEHSVIISGLTDGIAYYFRPIADRNGSTGEVVGIEVSYEPEKEGEVKGVTDTTTPSEPIECNYLLEYIKLGVDNNPVEVKKLERFLNEFEGENLEVNGIYEQADFDAVSRFQEKYFDLVLSPWNHNSSTGYVYITTKKRINEIYCQREFPLTPEQEEEIAKFKTMSGEFSESAETHISDDVSAGANSVEESISSEDIDKEESQEQKDSGEVAGVKDESGDETAEEYTEDGSKEDGSKEDDTGIVYADNGYSAYYFWAVIILLILIISVIYYITNIRRKPKKTE